MSAEDDLAIPAVSIAVQKDWHARCQHGCRFATLLSHDADNAGWGSLVVQISNNDDLRSQVGAEIRAAIATALAKPEVLAVSLLFPGITEPKSLIRLILQLQTELDWTLSVPDEDTQNPAPQLTRVLARLDIGASVMSWAIGFGPFDFLPFTRRAPITEIAVAMRPKSFPQRSPRLNADPSTAHLADVPVPVDDEAFEEMWADTEKAKKLLLGPSSGSLAKAKVTFAVPTDMWRTAHAKQSLRLVLSPDES